MPQAPTCFLTASNAFTAMKPLLFWLDRRCPLAHAQGGF
jgi:hypothetical protein